MISLRWRDDRRGVSGPFEESAISHRYLAALLVSPAMLSLPLAAAPVQSVQAQSVPGAGALQQQIERDRGAEPLPPVKPGPAPLPAPMRPDGALTVTVKAFRFAGARRISSARLAGALTGYLNRPLDFAGLRSAAAVVANLYRRQGWIVRAYLPAQDVKGGVVTIEVVEAVFGQARVEGPAGRVRPALVRATAAARLKPGQPLSAPALDRGLLLAGDLPGVTVIGDLKAGEAERQTDLILTERDRPLVSGDVGVDNAGERSTGAARALANLGLNSLLGVGDQITVGGIYSQGEDYVGGSVSAPIGADGLRIGLNGSYLDYRVVTADFADLRASGEATTLGLEARYPLIRARTRNLYLTVSLAHKAFVNDAAGTTTSRYRIDEASAALNGNLFDTLGGGGVNTASLALVYGDLDLNGSPSQALDLATARAEGRFGKLTWRLTRRQTIARDLSFLATVMGQAATKNLDSAEKFYLGGADGVRAYPVNEGSGADGQMINLALDRRLPLGFDLTGFYDWGHVTVNHGDLAGLAGPNDYALQGAGVTLAWRRRSGLRVEATYARRIGDNPNRTATGADQDGSLIRNRWWLTAGWAF